MPKLKFCIKAPVDPISTILLQAVSPYVEYLPANTTPTAPELIDFIVPLVPGVELING